MRKQELQHIFRSQQAKRLHPIINQNQTRLAALEELMKERKPKPNPTPTPTKSPIPYDEF